MYRRTLWSLTIALGLALSACGDDSTDPGGGGDVSADATTDGGAGGADGGTGGQPGQDAGPDEGEPDGAGGNDGTAGPAPCEVDLDLIAAEPGCAFDEQCPCGSHCAQGICVADCLTDDECEPGMLCNASGQCAEDPGYVAPVVAIDEGDLNVSPDRILLVSDTQETKVYLRALEGELTPVRVTAGYGLEMRCEDGGDFVEECMFEALVDEEGPLSVSVRTRASEPLPEPGEEPYYHPEMDNERRGAARTVHVFAGSQVAHVNVSIFEAKSVEPTSPIGRYQGFARPVAAWMGSYSTDPETAELLAHLEIPVFATVYDEPDFTHEDLDNPGPVIELEDPTGIFIANDDATERRAVVAAFLDADLSTSAGIFQVDQGLGDLLGTGGTPVVTEVDELGSVLAGGEPSNPAAWNAGVLTLSLEAGYVTGGFTAGLDWQVRLTRIGDTPEDFQALPFDLDAAATSTAQATPMLDSAETTTEAAKSYPMSSYPSALDSWSAESVGRCSSANTGPDFLAGAKAACEQWRDALHGEDELIGFQVQPFYYGPAGPPEGVTPLWDACSTDDYPDTNSDAFVQESSFVCAFSFELYPEGRDWTQSPPITDLVEGKPNPYDFCELAQELTGCEIDAPSVNEYLGQQNAVSAGCEGYPYPTPCTYVARVRKRCVIPTSHTPAVCIAPLCGGAQEASVPTGEVQPLTGDFSCGDEPFTMFPMLAADAPKGAEAIEACAAELGADIDNPKCVDRHAWRVALGRAWDAYEAPGDAVVHRLLAQWLEIAAFVARESIDELQLSELLGDLGTFDRTQARDAWKGSMAAWAPILGEGPFINQMLVEVVSDPDYRPRLDDGFEAPTDDSSPIGVGLPAVMLDTLAVQLETMEQLLERAHRLGGADLTESLDLAGDAVRLGYLVLSTAQGMRQRVEDISWNKAWEAAQQRAARALVNLRARVALADGGGNPLGIDDVDLPTSFKDAQSAKARFSAASDYLLNAPNVGAFDRADKAKDDEDDARKAWQDAQLSSVANHKQQSLEAKQEGAILVRYGEVIISMCGFEDELALTVLDADDDKLDPDTCFLRKDDNPACVYNEEEFSSRLTSADVGYQLCFANQLRKRLGDNVTTGDPNLDDLIDGEFGDLMDQADQGFGVRLASEIPSVKYAVKLNEFGGEDHPFYVDLGSLNEFEAQVGDGTPPEYLEDARDFCEARRAGQEDLRPSLPPDSCVITDDCPVGYLCEGGGCIVDMSENPLDSPDCYRGTMGELALTVRSSAIAVDKARAEMAEHTEAYDIAMKSCLIREAGNDAIEQELANHNEAMEVLNQANGVASGIGAALSGDIGGAFGAVTETMEASLEAQHEEVTLALQNQTDIEVCRNDAELHLVGIKSSSLAIKEAGIDLSRSLLEMRNAKATLAGTIADARAAKSLAERLRVSPFVHDFWLDDKVKDYHRRMKLARRSAYLAVRAVEYEYQLSLGNQRQAILEAKNVSELEEALDDLVDYSASLSINGTAPDENFEIVSLRNQVFRLLDGQGGGPGTKAMSAADRFRARLSSAEFAVYDNGEYRGQRIPFAIAPGSEFFVGDACAERVWSVSLNFVGGGKTTEPVQLLKRNTFYSQWCQSSGKEDEFQNASVRPTRNLFMAPDDLAELAGGFASNETEAYSKASLQVADIDVDTFEGPNPPAGNSEVLATRGLWGDYAIFIPVEAMDLDGRGKGLRLHEMDDILVRLDYVFGQK